MNGEVRSGESDLVIVTGAGRGIGQGIALEMAKAGAFVLCISKSDRARETAEQICRNGGRASSIAVDIRDYQATERAVRQWLDGKSFARVGAVLAAATLGPPGALGETNLQQWDDAFRVNVLGNLAVVRACLPLMLEKRYGRLLFFAGGGAAYAYPIFPAYAVSKAALVRAVENIHEDLKGVGDFASVILAPGAVETDTLAEVRKHGGFVKTCVPIGEPVGFARRFITAKVCNFSGCFVHVRDCWPNYLDTENKLSTENLWKLRRVERCE